MGRSEVDNFVLLENRLSLEDESRALSLDSARSVLGFEWALRDVRFPEAIQEPFDHIPEIVRQIIARRGFGDPGRWVRPTMKNEMPDPRSIEGMERAIARLADAVEQRTLIAIIGDYDVDGGTSTAILIRWLRGCGCPEPMFHIPQRLTEGYGPNIPAIESLVERGAGLLLIVDSGTTAMEQVARARELGIDVVVMDHHEPREDGVLPDAIVVNPKLGDAAHSYLCTAGLVFLGLVGVARELRERNWFAREGVAEPDLMSLLGLVALGTVADMVPLVGLNRAYVAHGLRRMPDNPGVAGLIEITKPRDPASAYAAGFVYGPCINAGGRIGDTGQGTRLLSTDDRASAAGQAARLNEQNVERRAIQERMVEQCIAQASTMVGEGTKAVVLYDPSWHPGVVGLGAQKTRDHFNVTAVVIGQDGKGSGRATPGTHIGLAFMRAVEKGLLKKGGGHAIAGGLTAYPERIEEFRAFMLEETRDSVQPPMKVDMEILAGDLGVDEVRSLSMLAPFGQGNREPSFVLKGGVLERVGEFKNGMLKGYLRRGRTVTEVVLFRGAGTKLGRAFELAEGHAVEVRCELQINEWNGNRTIQAKLQDLKVGAAVGSVADAA